MPFLSVSCCCCCAASGARRLNTNERTNQPTNRTKQNKTWKRERGAEWQLPLNYQPAIAAAARGCYGRLRSIGARLYTTIRCSSTTRRCIADDVNANNKFDVQIESIAIERELKFDSPINKTRFYSLALKNRCGDNCRLLRVYIPVIDRFSFRLLIFFNYYLK